VEATPSNRVKRISRGIPSVERCAVWAIRKLSQFQVFRFEHIPRSLPSNGNATATPIHAVQSLDLVLFSGVTCDQQRRKKTGRQHPTATNLLKKKNSSMTPPNAINILQKGASRGVAPLANI
jgi:hypothetical protein